VADAHHGEAGSYVKNSSLDGTRRIYSWRKVAGYPLIDLAAFGEAEALANAKREAAILIGLGVLALGLSVVMMVMLTREISRGVQHAIARDAEAENARQASQVKSAFLAKMSHELRTPLNAILGFAEIIRDKAFGNDVDRYADYSRDIYQSGAHLLSIVNDILDVSKIEAGRLELREEKIEIGQIIQESLVAIERQAAISGVTVTNTNPEASAFIMGDRTKLKQIILNLLSNAVKFTPSGGSVNVAVRVETDGGLTLMIRDTGIGMSSEELKNALELFGQAENSFSGRFQGTGLGLPLAVQLTEMHGGMLTVDSAPGLGTAVTVHFPAIRITGSEGE
jgi:signal transduction histidine kinase